MDDDIKPTAPYFTVAPERRYRHLVRVPHSWRRQLSLKGRRLTVCQLISQIRANGMDVERAADEFDLPAAAVLEALDYASRNADLIAREAAEEREYVEHPAERP